MKTNSSRPTFAIAILVPFALICFCQIVTTSDQNINRLYFTNPVKIITLASHRYISGFAISPKYAEVLLTAHNEPWVGPDNNEKTFKVDLQTGVENVFDNGALRDMQFSPNGEMIAYNLIVSSAVDVVVMDRRNKIKKRLTDDGRSHFEKWASNSEILLSRGSFTDTAAQGNSWLKTGYVKINISNEWVSGTFQSSQETPKARAEALPVELKEINGAWSFIYKGRTVFQGPAVATETEEAWKPALKKIDDNTYLTVVFEPFPNAKINDGYYYSGEGVFDLVKLNVEAAESLVLEKDIEARPFFEDPPNKKYVLFKKSGREIGALSRDLIEKRHAVEKKDLLLDEEVIKYLKWSPDSRFFILETSAASGLTLYKVDLE
jgi:hypothetical protein